MVGILLQKIQLGIGAGADRCFVHLCNSISKIMVISQINFCIVHWTLL